VSDPERTDAQAERFVPSRHGALMTHEHSHRYALAAALLRGARVLDLGSGSGYGARLLREAGARVTGLDLDAAAVRLAAPAVRASAECLPFADASFDAVVCFEMIEHVPRPERVADEIARVLGRNGIALVSTPDRSIYTERAGNRNPYHLREMTRAEFAALLAARFPAVALYGQSVWSGSWLAQLDAAGEASDARSRRVQVVALAADPDVPRAPWVDPASAGFPTPLYLVALCARSAASLQRYARRVGVDNVLHDREQRLIGEHFQMAETLAQRDGEIEAHAAHAGNVEALARRAEERVAALEKHVANLESRAAGRTTRIERLEQHVANVEAEARASQTHAANLERMLAERESRVGALEGHVANVEAEARASQTHAANLERMLAERESRVGALEGHVANLERMLAERESRVGALEGHVANLESVVAERTARVGGLQDHAANLEAIIEERRTRVQGLEAHAEGLEALLGQRETRVDSLEKHAQNLEVLLGGAEQRGAALDERLALADAQTLDQRAALEQERAALAAARERLAELRATRWFRLGQRLHRIE
jgi:SAM-dependent methyltransferase